jgi:hypothetical protein
MQEISHHSAKFPTIRGEKKVAIEETNQPNASLVNEESAICQVS